MQRDRGHCIAEQLQLLQTGLSGAAAGAFILRPHVFVPDLVRGQRLQLARGQEVEHRFRDQQHGSSVQGDGRLGDVNHLDLVPIPLRRLENQPDRSQVAQRARVEARHLAGRRKGAHDPAHVFGRHRPGSGGLHQLDEGGGGSVQEIPWIGERGCLSVSDGPGSHTTEEDHGSGPENAADR